MRLDGQPCPSHSVDWFLLREPNPNGPKPKSPTRQDEPLRSQDSCQNLQFACEFQRNSHVWRSQSSKLEETATLKGRNWNRLTCPSTRLTARPRGVLSSSTALARLGLAILGESCRRKVHWVGLNAPTDVAQGSAFQRVCATGRRMFWHTLVGPHKKGVHRTSQIRFCFIYVHHISEKTQTNQVPRFGGAGSSNPPTSAQCRAA